MNNDRPVLLFGATGYTGRCCLDALEANETPYLLAGRNMERLQHIAGSHCIGIRHADARNIHGAFEGAGCVLSTVGPFAQLGSGPLDAAIAAGAHWVDTTAEQTFLHQARLRDSYAKKQGVTVTPACGVEYLPMFLGASLLGDGPVSTYLWLDDFLPTRGSVRSMVAMAGVGPIPRPIQVTFDSRSGWAIPIPGAEALFIHPDSKTHLVLAAHEAWAGAVLWPMARWFRASRFADAIAARVTDPTDTQRRRARFTIVITRGNQALRIDGQDVYGSTGIYAAYVATQLANNMARCTGVVSAGRALPIQETMDAVGLKLVRFTLH